MGSKFTTPYSRVMDLAFMRDSQDNIYTDEALVLACLLHAKGKRNQENVREVAKLLDDPNEPRSK